MVLEQAEEERQRRVNQGKLGNILRLFFKNWCTMDVSGVILQVTCRRTHSRADNSNDILGSGQGAPWSCSLVAK